LSGRIAYEQHIEELARTHRVTVLRLGEEMGTEGCCADCWAWEVVLPASIRTKWAYFLALHEFGHLLDPDARRGYFPLEREWSAWQWAFENAWCDVTGAIMWRVWSDDAFGSYFEYAVLDGEGDEF